MWSVQCNDTPTRTSAGLCRLVNAQQPCSHVMQVAKYIMLMYVICLHTYLPVYMPTYMHTDMHTYLRTYVRTCVRTYIHTCIHTYVHTYIHTSINASLYVYSYMYTSPYRRSVQISYNYMTIHFTCYMYTDIPTRAPHI